MIRSIEIDFKPFRALCIDRRRSTYNESRSNDVHEIKKKKICDTLWCKFTGILKHDVTQRTAFIIIFSKIIAFFRLVGPNVHLVVLGFIAVEYTKSIQSLRVRCYFLYGLQCDAYRIKVKALTKCSDSGAFAANRVSFTVQGKV